jgi:hypothetical protein
MSSKKTKRKVKKMEDVKEKKPSKAETTATGELVCDEVVNLFEAEQRAQVKKACEAAFKQWLSGAADLSDEAILAAIPERTKEHIETLCDAQNEYTDKGKVAKREAPQVMKELGLPGAKKPQASAGTDFIPPWLRKKTAEK